MSASLLDDVVAVAGAMQGRAKRLHLDFRLSLAVGASDLTPANVAPFAEAFAPGTAIGTDVSDWSVACARRGSTCYCWPGMCSLKSGLFSLFKISPPPRGKTCLNQREFSRLLCSFQDFSLHIAR